MLSAAALLWTLALLPQDAKPPSEGECKKLIGEYFAALELGEGGSDERDRILERLDLFEPLSASKAKTWRKRVLGEAEDRAELESSPGSHTFGDALQYHVGGKTSRPKAILIHLHGRRPPGSADNVTIQNPFLLAGQAQDWVVIMPRSIEGEMWSEPRNERFVLGLIDAALRTWKVEPDAVFLSGSSAGAYGAWLLGSRHADRLAGLLPFSGGPTVLIRGDDLLDGVIPNMRSLPVSQFHSVDDPLTPVKAAREGARKLVEARERWGGGFTHHYLEIPGKKHGAPPKGAGPIFEKVADERRPARPERVVWQPTTASKGTFYWLSWAKPRKGALVVADLDSKQNAIHVSCEGGVEGLEVLIDGELLELDKRDVLVTLNGEEAFRGKPERSLAVLLRTAALGDEGLSFEAAIPLKP